MKDKDSRVTECMTPYTVKTTGDIVPCGKCENCRSRLVSQWSFRILQEEKNCTSAWFITLTYDTRHVPITKQGFLSLRYKDVQKLFKLLRRHGENDLKYYVVGEYGAKRNRPHYHIILFNLKSTANVINYWKHGEVFFGSCTGASVGYCLKYMHKNKKGRYYPNDDREPCKGRMSKGIGKGYLTENMVKWHQKDPTQRVYGNLPGGQKVSLPRYYRERIYTDAQKAEILAHIQNTKASEPFKRQLIEKYPDRWQEIFASIIAQQDIKQHIKSQKGES